MKVYGTLDMQNNIIANLALDVETDFPAVAPEGRIVFKNNILYISVVIEGSVSWIPLTNELQTLVYTNGFADTSWVIDHNYNTYSIIVQVYDTDKKIIIPDDIQMTTLNQITVTFSSPQAGSAVIISKREV